jgi:hypothetical protein
MTTVGSRKIRALHICYEDVRGTPRQLRSCPQYRERASVCKSNLKNGENGRAKSRGFASLTLEASKKASYNAAAMQQASSESIIDSAIDS